LQLLDPLNGRNPQLKAVYDAEDCLALRSSAVASRESAHKRARREFYLASVSSEARKTNEEVLVSLKPKSPSLRRHRCRHATSLRWLESIPGRSGPAKSMCVSA
jgi:hypothetical protein